MSRNSYAKSRAGAIDRRSFIAGAISLPLSTSAVTAQSTQPVRLLVARQPARIPQTDCLAPCIRGQIFDVTGMGSFDGIILAGLVANPPICDTIERPWRDNAPNVSSIPRGDYVARVRSDATKSWMTSIDRRWRLELDGVPHRANIQFHFGEDEKWSEGCFIVGRHLSQGSHAEDYCKLEAAEAAIKRLREAITAAGRNQDDIRVGVTDWEGLTPIFEQQAACG